MPSKSPYRHAKKLHYGKKAIPEIEAVKAPKAGELAEWKRQSRYHQRSKAETAMYRYKQLISPKLSLRSHNAQVGEILAGVKVLNKVIGLGMPIRQPNSLCHYNPNKWLNLLPPRVLPHRAA